MGARMWKRDIEILAYVGGEQVVAISPKIFTLGVRRAKIFYLIIIGRGHIST